MVLGLLSCAFGELQKLLVVREVVEEREHPPVPIQYLQNNLSGNEGNSCFGDSHIDKDKEENDSEGSEHSTSSDDDIYYDCNEFLHIDSDSSDIQDVLIIVDKPDILHIKDEEIVNKFVEHLIQSVTYFVKSDELCCTVEETFLIDHSDQQLFEESPKKETQSIEITQNQTAKQVIDLVEKSTFALKEESLTLAGESNIVEELPQVEKSCLRKSVEGKKHLLVKQHAIESFVQELHSISVFLILKKSQDSFITEIESEDSGFVENFIETLLAEPEDSIPEVVTDEPLFVWDNSRFIIYQRDFHIEPIELSKLYLIFKGKMALPRELMLIINDISEQNCHLLEWEVFGNSSEDMRVVLTWRRLDKKNKPRRHSQGKWKLRQSSVSTIGDDEDEESFPPRKHSSDNWEFRQKGGSDGKEKRQPYDEGEYKDRTGGSKKTSAAGEDVVGVDGNRKKTPGTGDDDEYDADGKKKRGPYDEGEYKESSKDDLSSEGKGDENKESNSSKHKEGDGSKFKDDEDGNSNKTKKKNPFRKMTKQQKLKMKRSKLQLSFSSIDQDDDSSEISGDLNNNTEGATEEDGESKRNKRDPYDEGEYKERSNMDGVDEAETEKSGSDDKAGKEEVAGKNIINFDDDEEEKRKRGVYDEGEYKKRSGEDDASSQDQLRKGKQISELDDVDGERKARGEYDEGEYSHRRGSKVTEIEPVEMKDFDPSKREKFDDEASETSSTAGADITLDKPLEEISAEDIKGKKQAKKVLDMQREKMQVAVDEPSENVHEELNGLDRRLTARELREANLLSLANDFGAYEGGPLQKKLILPKPPKGKSEKELEEDESINKHSGVTRLKPTLHGKSVTGWERCVDCKYNSFCDDLVHKSEYMAILLHDRENDTADTEACKCNVCNGGAVHNGCIYRELLRLKTEYRLFDKRNLCLCSVCIPFKYRKVCLRQELRNLRKDGVDLYYRLTYHGDDGKEGYHPNLNGYLEDSEEDSEDEVNVNGVNLKRALCLNDVDMEITKQDKIDFRNCIDCSFNGFCDDIRHKKLYLLLLRLDIEEFDELDDECSCMVCEFKGAAHSGCARREMIRLKYDFLLYDTRNLCYCPQCVPFKYRTMCLRQELKLLRRRKNIDLYCNL